MMRVYVMYPDPETALSRLVNMCVNFERFVVVAAGDVEMDVSVLEVEVVREEATVLEQLGFEFARSGPNWMGLHPGS